MSDVIVQSCLPPLKYGIRDCIVDYSSSYE
nr:MAG TPA: hypothetical protein [Caudoviricetes sp.]DAV45469.1 MAG TPA: hypothetical protein [Caudoviricetes sp.]